MRNSVADSALRQAVDLLCADEWMLWHRGHGIPVKGLSGDPALLHVIPLRRSGQQAGLDLNAIAAVFVAPGGSNLPPPAPALSALFDLTPAEAKIFTQAAQGMTIAEMAVALGVNSTTMKTPGCASTEKPTPSTDRTHETRRVADICRSKLNDRWIELAEGPALAPR